MNADHPRKQKILHACLEKAADQLGDIQPLVMKRFYEHYPQGRDLFIQHAYGMTARLETDMVESALYCLMSWFERPIEVRIILDETVPHHDSLHIPSSAFFDLLQSVLDVIGETIDASDTDTLAVWHELEAALVAETSSRFKKYHARHIAKT